MKYYSEILKKNFDTVEDLEAAESKEKKRIVDAEKERMAAEAARKEKVTVAKAELDEALQDYKSAIKRYDETITEMKKLLINAETKYFEKKKQYEEATSGDSKKNRAPEYLYNLSDMFRELFW